MKHLLRTLLMLTLCLLTALSPALSEGFRFTLRAEADPAQVPGELQALTEGMAALLEAASVDGTLALSGTSFELDATMHMGSGWSACDTTLRLFGTDSHWGLRSSLLGETELMINCAALLPFGQKARDHMGLPLDMAALAVPYTHVDSLSSVMAALAPLFPAENGTTNLTRAELDGIVNELLRLSEEDAAFSRWLDATGLRRTFRRYCRGFASVSQNILPGLKVTRKDGSLTWSAGLLPVMSLEETRTGLTGSFSIPLLLDMNLNVQTEGPVVTGSAKLTMDGSSASLAFTLPAAFPCELDALSLAASWEITGDTPRRFRLLLDGECHGKDVTLRLLNEATALPMLTLSATLEPFAPETLPAYTPEQLTGMNALSVTGDSLRELLLEVWQPLLTGCFDLIAAAPPQAVQTLMDVLEDSGVIDLLTDSLSGGSGY